MITINALKVRTKLGSILDNVAQKGEHYIIERLGKPLAVLAPYDKFDHQKLYQGERRKRLEIVSKAMDKWREKHGSKYRGEDSTSIIRRMRDAR